MAVDGAVAGTVHPPEFSAELADHARLVREADAGDHDVVVRFLRGQVVAQLVDPDGLAEHVAADLGAHRLQQPAHLGQLLGLGVPELVDQVHVSKHLAVAHLDLRVEPAQRSVERLRHERAVETVAVFEDGSDGVLAGAGVTADADESSGHDWFSDLSSLIRSYSFSSDSGSSRMQVSQMNTFLR